MDTLKDCPFCGASARICYLQPEYCKNESDRYFVFCTNEDCGIHGRRGYTEKEAVDGVNSGKYYAAIVIAPDFSESMYTALSDNFKNPKITYYENEKKNAVGTTRGLKLSHKRNLVHADAH